MMISLRDLSKPSGEYTYKRKRRPKPKKPKRPGKPGRPKGAKNKLTLLDQAKAELAERKKRGEMLGLDYLRDIACQAWIVMHQYQPFNNKAGTARKKGNMDYWMRSAAMLHDVAADIAQYEQPKLAAIAVAGPGDMAVPSGPRCVNIKVDIFNERGRRIAQVINGEDQALPAPGDMIDVTPNKEV
jgi:hypothetical protein